MLATIQRPPTETAQHPVQGRLLSIHRQRPSVSRGEPLRIYLVHGLGDTSDAWRALVDELSAVGVWTFDLPWSGREGNDWPQRLGATDWWRAAAARLPEQPDVCIGHSISAGALMEWLFGASPSSSSSLRALGLVSPSCAGSAPLDWSDLNRLAYAVSRQLEAVLRTRLNGKRGPSAWAVSTRLARRVVADGLLEFLRLLLKRRRWSLRAGHRSITILFGEEDDVSVRESVLGLAGVMPHPPVRGIEGFGHFPVLEQPREGQQHVVDLLESLVAGAKDACPPRYWFGGGQGRVA